MIIEKTNTAQHIIEKITPGADKISYIANETLAAALLCIENQGVPTAKHEDYKYCNFDAVLKKEFKNITQEFAEIKNIKHLKLPGTITLVLINGRYSTELSDKNLPQEINAKKLSALDENEKEKIASLAQVADDPFIALNTAFSSDGLHLVVKKSNTPLPPVHIIYLATPLAETIVNTRSFILTEENAEALIIEEQTVIGEGKVFTNYLSEKLVMQNAKLIGCVFQNEGKQGFSVNTNQVKIERYGKYENTTITLSGQVVRNNHNVVLSGASSEAHLYGLFSSTGSQLVDNHTLIDHQVADCESNELYKGIANDKSVGVFNGKIFVRRDAQKTNAYQSSKNILLSNDAAVNAKPQLEIYANDVKCSHGTSTGKIDENALFYLYARGIGKQSARKMLLLSFAQEIIDKIPNENLREKISAMFEQEI